MKSRLVVMLALASSIAACGKDSSKPEGTKPTPTTPSTPTTPTTPTTASPTRLAVTVTEKGFEPDGLQVAAGKPVTLVFTRKTDKTCAKEVVIQQADGTKIEKPLPLDQPVEIATTFPAAGTLTYACAMDMVKGTITVQ